MKLAYDINDLQHSNYYVEKVSTSNGANNIRVIPIKDQDGFIDFSQKKNSYPAIVLWQAAKEVLGKKFGIDVVFDMNGDEIKDRKSKAKAYIQSQISEDGQEKTVIHINMANASSQDLFHEYTHVALAILKQNNRNAYLKLIQTVWKLGYNKDVPSEEQRRIMDAYQNYSLEDKMEEFFCEKFGRWVNGKTLDKSFGSIFENDKSLEEASYVFNDTSDKLSVKELWGTTVGVIFSNFSKQIGRILHNEKDIVDSNFFNTFKLQRQKSEWIRKQIENKVLKEECK